MGVASLLSDRQTITTYSLANGRLTDIHSIIFELNVESSCCHVATPTYARLDPKPIAKKD